MEQKSYDKYPGNKDRRGDSTVGETVYIHLGSNLPLHLWALVSEGRETEQLWGKCAIAIAAIFPSLPNHN